MASKFLLSKRTSRGTMRVKRLGQHKDHGKSSKKTQHHSQSPFLPVLWNEVETQPRPLDLASSRAH